MKPINCHGVYENTNTLVRKKQHLKKTCTVDFRGQEKKIQQYFQ